MFHFNLTKKNTKEILRARVALGRKLGKKKKEKEGKILVSWGAKSQEQEGGKACKLLGKVRTWSWSWSSRH